MPTWASTAAAHSAHSARWLAARMCGVIASSPSANAATASGGVWKSADAGDHWLPVTDGLPSLSIGDIAIDPSDKNTIYCGTGEPNGGGGSVTNKDLVIFTRQFATMIDAGLPIVQCLDILQGQTQNKRFAVILRDVKNSVESGATFTPKS